MKHQIVENPDHISPPMKISVMIPEILNIIDTKYPKNVKDCMDIQRIKTFCSLFKPKSKSNSNSNSNYKNIAIIDIALSSPDISKITKNNQSKNNKLNSPEFHKIYSFFIKLLYACLKLDIEIFDINDKYCVIKNNYNLIKSIEACRKKIINDHIDILQKQLKKISLSVINEYEIYTIEYVSKLKIFDKLVRWVNLLEKNDNLFSLILPHFYTYTEYIEEYVG